MKKNFFNWGFLIIHTVWILSILIAFFFIFDGTVNPVVTPMIIDENGFELINQADNESLPWYRVNGVFEKKRECQLISLQWFYGNIDLRSSQNRIPVATLVNPNRVPVGEPIDLSTGNHATVNLQVKLTPENILNNSYAYVYHDCYPFLPFNWYTRSIFYDSNIQQKHQDDDH